MYIESKNLSKKYYSTFTQYLKLGKGSARDDDFWALKDVSFRIDDGERVGIIGRNGAGKSTLLNILSGFSKQTSGELFVNGKVAPVMEIGSSINPEETGRKNIITAGRLSNIDPAELERKVQEIIDFVDLGEYIDQPMKIYSSGMIAKISFGCVMFTKPEILLIDEVLGVGDAEFRSKSEAKLRELCEDGKILLMVSHSMAAIRKYTERCIWLDKGAILMDGPSREVTEAFEAAIKNEEEEKLVASMKKATEGSEFYGQVVIRTMEVFSEEHHSNADIRVHDPVSLEMELEAAQDLEEIDLRVDCYSIRGYLLFSSSYKAETGMALRLSKAHPLKVRMRIDDCNFNTGTYQVMASVRCNEEEAAHRAVLFRVFNDRYYNYLDRPQVYYQNHVKLIKLHREQEHTG